MQFKFISNILFCFLFLFMLTLFNEQVFLSGAMLHDKNTDISNERLSLYKTTYQHNPPNNKDKRLLLGADATGSTDPWSNAFNFKKEWGAQTDGRTGILSLFFKTGSLISNMGHGPNISLSVNYNSSNTANPDDIAPGWIWNLTHFDYQTNQLFTSQGQSFTLDRKGYGHWVPRYHKLNDILITGDKSTHFIITYPNGLRETLSHGGYLVKMEQEDGRSVRFNYIPGTHRLQSVGNNNESQIKLAWDTGYITVISQGDNGQPIKVRIDNLAGALQNISLPLQDNSKELDIHINYLNNNHHLISQINYPNGLIKKISWNCSSAMEVPAKDEKNKSLCVVTQEKVFPGMGQPEMQTSYTYTRANANQHNYLAYNSGLTLLAGSKNDILFEAPTDYTYRTEKNDGTTTQIHTYNKYHLMIDAKLISNSSDHLLSETENYFCRTDVRDGCAHTSFKDLPATYSLPLKIVTKTWGNTSEKPSVRVVTKSYDNQGRVIKGTDEYGRSFVTAYCPAKGDSACPAMPEGWSLATLPESTTNYPASLPGTSSPPVTVKNYYCKEANLQGNSYLLVLDHQVRQSGDQKIIIRSHYYDNPKNKFTYGLLKQRIINGNSAVTSPDLTRIIHDYRYIKNANNHTKTMVSFTELGNGKLLPSSWTTVSLFTNQVLQKNNPSKTNITRYHYNSLAQITHIDTAVGTSFAATNRFTYVVSPTLNELIMETPNGVQNKETFDGLGRVLDKYEAQPVDKKYTTVSWKHITHVSYDSFGHPVNRRLYLPDKSMLATKEEYDDLGRVISVHGIDGTTSITRYDDADRCVVGYKEDAQKERSAISVVKANVINKTTEKIILPATIVSLPDITTLCTKGEKQPGAIISRFTYDGFGRVIATKDPKGHLFQKRYDSLGRLTDIIGPGGSRMHQQLNLSGKIVAQWQLPASGGKYLLSSAAYNAAGQLLWEAGETGKRALFTYTEDGNPETTTTPSGHILSWIYNKVGLPVSQSVDGKATLQKKYDPVTLKTVSKNDNTGITRYYYTVKGLIKQLVHTGINSYPDYKLQWKYDINERIASSTDVSGNKTLREYDSLGRIKKISYQSTDGKISALLIPVYDGFSREIKEISDSGISRFIHYDAYGRKQKVTDLLNNTLLSQWDFQYDTDNNITMLSKKAENGESGILNYWYNSQGDLTRMTCSGSSGLPLCPRDTNLAGSILKRAPVITEQNYTFTPLNKMAQVKETLIDIAGYHKLRKIVNYSYDDNTPLRLSQISTQWNQNASVIYHFNYDVAGNMITDIAGDQITYNALNQITAVNMPTGKQIHYFYNGEGKEVKETMDSGTNYLIYNRNSLINEMFMSPGSALHTTGYLGVAQTLDGHINKYYENNYKGDIIAVLKPDRKNHHQSILSQRNVYSPYGMVWHNTQTPDMFWQQARLGFNGERTDPATGWQFLGAGHRTYNPGIRCFLSEDPAGGGYGFAGNNPVMANDPSGNLPKWFGKVSNLFGYISSYGLKAVNKKMGRIISAITAGAATVGNIGLLALSAGASAKVTLAVMAGVAAPAILPVVAAASPNKGLDVASKVIGAGAFVATTAAIAMQFGLSFFFTAAVAGSAEVLNTERTTGSGITAALYAPSPDHGASAGSDYYFFDSFEELNLPSQEIPANEASAVSDLLVDHIESPASNSISIESEQLPNSDQMNDFIDRTSTGFQVPNLQNIDKTGLVLALRDFRFSRALVFENNEQAVYDATLDRQRLFAWMEEVYEQKLAVANEKGPGEVTIASLYLQSFNVWLNAFGRGFTYSFDRNVEEFYQNMIAYRRKIGYYGPIYTQEATFHPNFRLFVAKHQ